MKRGLIAWDKSEIPPSAFAARVETVRRVLVERGFPALAVYSELWRSNPARFFSNYMPYFNRALLIISRDFPPSLLCGLSPRVYGWIRSVTTIEDVRPAQNFAKPLFEIAAERQWPRIAAMELDQFPYDIFKALRGGPIDVANLESSAVFAPGMDESEMAARRKASESVKRILNDEIASAPGVLDHHFVGRLEGRFRNAGAEDLVVLVTNGRSVPAPPAGAVLAPNFSVSVAMEYRGHWVRYSRPHGGPEILSECRKAWEKKLADSSEASTTPGDLWERMDTSYPYEPGRGAISALHIEVEFGGKRLFYGDTIL